MSMNKLIEIYVFVWYKMYESLLKQHNNVGASLSVSKIRNLFIKRLVYVSVVCGAAGGLRRQCGGGGRFARSVTRPPVTCDAAGPPRALRNRILLQSIPSMHITIGFPARIEFSSFERIACAVFFF